MTRASEFIEQNKALLVESRHEIGKAVMNSKIFIQADRWGLTQNEDFRKELFNLVLQETFDYIF